jgi:hypothetical protein
MLKLTSILLDQASALDLAAHLAPTSRSFGTLTLQGAEIQQGHSRRCASTTDYRLHNLCILRDASMQVISWKTFALEKSRSKGLQASPYRALYRSIEQLPLTATIIRLDPFLV